MAPDGIEPGAAPVLRFVEQVQDEPAGPAQTERYDAVVLYRLDVPQRFPAAWRALQSLAGSIDEREMNRTFNNGIGMVVVVPPSQAEAAKAHLQAQGETVYQIGHIVAREDEAVVLNNLKAGPQA